MVWNFPCASAALQLLVGGLWILLLWLPLPVRPSVCFAAVFRTLPCASPPGLEHLRVCTARLRACASRVSVRAFRRAGPPGTCGVPHAPSVPTRPPCPRPLRALASCFRLHSPPLQKEHPLEETNGGNTRPQVPGRATPLRMRLPPSLSREELLKLGSVSIFLALGHLLSTVAPAYGTVAFTNVVKTLEPLFTCAFSAIFFGQTFSAAVYLSLLPVIAGVVLATANEANRANPKPKPEHELLPVIAGVVFATANEAKRASSHGPQAKSNPPSATGQEPKSSVRSAPHADPRTAQSA